MRSDSAMWAGLFQMSMDSGQTLQAQIRQTVVAAILNGQIPAAQPLPSCRTLARHINVARGTVVLAYQHLVDQGFLIARERHGHFVNPDILPSLDGEASVEPAREGPGPDWSSLVPPRLKKLQALDKPRDWLSYRYPFVYGQFDPSLFPTNEWRECVRMALGVREIYDWAADMVDKDDPLLIEQIRTRILPRRGIFARSDEVVVTLGAQNGLFLLASLLLRKDSAVAMEDPGYPDARLIFGLHTDRVVPVPVDAKGLDPSQIPEDCRIVFCTPSHQCPTAARLPIARRQALLSWAGASDGLIIEDDYDSQLLDDMESGEAALPALKSLDKEGRVVFVGSLSKTLAPGLRLGYLVGDADLIADLRRLRRLMLRHPPANNQRAVAIFLSLGHHDALIRRLSASIREKRQTLRAALSRHLPDFDHGPGRAGTSLWLQGPKGFDADRLVEAARAESVIVEPGRVFHADPRGAGNTFRMGVTAIEMRRIEDGVRALARAASGLPLLAA
ncbi:MocR-like pyridoxine biosynthesis transcription factor PdxR [Afifella pfennigii]|uniref:MocR-like pyridoxine biosynthesis transcription factor PdxR n=1 Tax=Afifella pfennigii TaxID=209897 RepID=UPI00047B7ADF|nr:PLP-dependent aminotransferase family protein [Afifella pfennigii]